MTGKSLTGQEINDLISNNYILKNHYKGILTHTELEKICLKDGEFHIIFRKKEGQEIGHWTALFLVEGTFEYFDSLGENFDQLVDFKLKLMNQHSLATSNITFQCTNSNCCGQFVLYFCFHRVLNLLDNFPTVLMKIFSLNCSRNTLLVTQFVNNKL